MLERKKEKKKRERASLLAICVDSREYQGDAALSPEGHDSLLEEEQPRRESGQPVATVTKQREQRQVWY